MIASTSLHVGDMRNVTSAWERNDLHLGGTSASFITTGTNVGDFGRPL